jgi:hypothetical protein
MLEESAKTVPGLLAQVREQWDKLLERMGRPSLTVLSNFFTKLLDKMQNGDFSKAANMGAKIISGILTGLTNGATRIMNWFTALTNNPEFEKRTTLSAKVDFIMSDLYEKFKTWYSGGGSDKIEKMAKDLTGFIADSIDANATRFADVGLKIGAQIGDGIRKGLAKRIGGVIEYDPDKKYNPSDNLLNPDDFLSKTPPKKNGGLNFVPRDGAVYSLHRGEQVLTRNEADEYRKNGGKSNGITINVAKMEVRQDSDIKTIAMQLARLI